ncbi:MAG: 50S ribosomal protein L6 [Deltaproteobacteria bacterium]|nr:50S ribosomal protein L6 [Deltaproteobacteria bacterium]
MSRIGKRPIVLPAGVKVEQKGQVVTIQGPKGRQEFHMNPLVGLDISAQQLLVKKNDDQNRQADALMGTTQSILQNMVEGVSKGFSKKLILNGVGYRAAVSGRKLDLTLGFSHPVNYPLPEGVNAQVEGNNIVILNSHDKVLLGQVAAKIRSYREPEPYQGKGVAYEGERIRRKAGKTGKK